MGIGAHAWQYTGRPREHMVITIHVEKTLMAAIDAARLDEAPYPHWYLHEVFPADDLTALQTLPFPAPDLGGVSGTREVHNATRVYFDAENQRRFAVCAEISDVFQQPSVAGHIADVFGADLDGTYLRIEYGQDVDGFWLGPHTDIGVKRFTMLVYLSDGEGHEDLGTDIYADAETRVGRSDFRPNLAMVFVPSDRTWHGFTPRPINGVRKSLIINYVTNEWRDREQLSFPDAPVRL